MMRDMPMERAFLGITTTAWEAAVLPLNYTRDHKAQTNTALIGRAFLTCGPAPVNPPSPQFWEHAEICGAGSPAKVP